MAIIFAAYIIMSVSSCESGNDSKQSSVVSDSSSKSNVLEAPISAVESQTETLTEPPTVPQTVRDIQPAEGTYIYDYAELLSDESFNTCNDYAEWLSKNYSLNVAAVITDHIEGMTPEAYAEEVYRQFFGDNDGSGLLILLNNDTNQDVVYKHGSVPEYVTEHYEQLAILSATREIAEGNFEDAVTTLLMLGELCPK